MAKRKLDSPQQSQRDDDDSGSSVKKLKILIQQGIEFKETTESSTQLDNSVMAPPLQQDSHVEEQNLSEREFGISHFRSLSQPPVTSGSNYSSDCYDTEHLSLSQQTHGKKNKRRNAASSLNYDNFLPAFSRNMCERKKFETSIWYQWRGGSEGRFNI